MDASVDTKCLSELTFGNDAIGFIRVRHRKLKGNPDPDYARHYITASASFDLVRAVRIDGKPRHKFILGLGSWQQGETRNSDGKAFQFWAHAFYRLIKHGFDVTQRRRPADEMVRKGGPLPTFRSCRQAKKNPWNKPEVVDEIIAWRAKRTARHAVGDDNQRNPKDSFERTKPSIK